MQYVWEEYTKLMTKLYKEGIIKPSVVQETGLKFIPYVEVYKSDFFPVTLKKETFKNYPTYTYFLIYSYTPAIYISIYKYQQWQHVQVVNPSDMSFLYN